MSTLFLPQTIAKKKYFFAIVCGITFLIKYLQFYRRILKSANNLASIQNIMIFILNMKTRGILALSWSNFCNKQGSIVIKQEQVSGIS